MVRVMFLAENHPNSCRYIGKPLIAQAGNPPNTPPALGASRIALREYRMAWLVRFPESECRCLLHGSHDRALVLAIPVPETAHQPFIQSSRTRERLWSSQSATPCGLDTSPRRIESTRSCVRTVLKRWPYAYRSFRNANFSK